MDSVDIRDLLAHEDFVRRLARRLIRDDDRAEDVVQKTWLAALQRPPRQSETVLSWLASVVRRTSFRMMTQEQSRRRWEERSARGEGVLSTREVLEREASRRRVVTAVLELEEPYRTGILLRYFQGWPPRKIAKFSRVPVATVKTRLRRGLSLLRGRLESEMGEDRKAWFSSLVALAQIEPATTTLLTTTSSLAPGVVMMSLKTKIALGSLALIAVTLTLTARTFLPGESKPPGRSPIEARVPVQVPSGEERERVVSDRLDPERSEGLRPASRTLSEGEEEMAPELVPIPGAIVGRVVSRSGTVLSGVAVEARFDLPRDRTRISLPRESSVLSETRSGFHGEFRVEAPEGVPIRLEARFENHAPGIARRCFAGERRDLVLLPGTRVRVAVSDRGSGAALVGADVHVTSVEDLPVSIAFEKRTRTDEEGMAELRFLPEGRFYVSAKLHGYAPALRSISSDGDGVVELSCELDAEAVVRGVVLDAVSETPIAGAWVSAGRSSQRSQTDVEGRYELGGFGASESAVIGLVAQSEGYGPDAVYATFPRPGHVHRVDFFLRPGLVVRGRVRDSEGRPLSRARVRYEGRFSTNPYTAEFVDGETHTDLDGEFEFDAVRPEGRYVLGIGVQGWGLTASSFGPLSAEDGVHDLGTFVLSRPGMLSGKVNREGTEQERGDPSPPDLVTLDLLLPALDSSSNRVVPLSLALVEEGRRFRFDDLSSGLYRLQSFGWNADDGEHRERPRATLTVRLDEGQRREGLLLRAGRVVRGRLVSSEGEGLSGRMVSLLSEEEGLKVDVETGGEGRFEFLVEGVGPYRLQYVDRSLSYQNTHVSGVIPGEGEYRLIADPKVTNFSQRGRILAEDGTPITDVYVQFTVAETGLRLSGRVAVPDADGYFRMENLDPVAYHLEIIDFDDRYHPARLENVLAGDEVVQFLLKERP